MRHKLGIALLLASVGWSGTAQAQRPHVGLGLGAGAILGSRLVDHELSVPVDDRALVATREVNLEDVAALSANAEWYVTRHIALRLHGAWGAGRLQIETAFDTDAEVKERSYQSDFGDVHISALDAGVSIWPWAPGSVGFAPFVTAGIGRFTYDFDAGTEDGLFRADGSRSERAWLVGFGADLNVWHSITLRIEAVDHVVDSPLDPSDFDESLGPLAPGTFGGSVNNIRLTIGAHIYLPFRTYDLPGES